MKHLKTTSSVSKKTVNAVTLAFILVLAGLVYSSFAVHRMNHKLSKLRADTAAQAQLLYNEIDYQKALQRPVVALQTNTVVFPELKITLPYDDVTKTLQYSISDQANVGTSVTSTLLSDHKMRQLSCSDLVRVNFTSGTPFSPWEELTGSVKLADGRTMYIMAAKAYKNNQASSLSCAAEVWRNVTPGAVADEFKKVVAY